MRQGHKAILWFDEVTKEDIPSVGGKGANLGEMTKAGIPVPPGFVVTANAYYDFLEQSKITAEIRDLSSVTAIVNHAHQQKERSRRKPVVQHLNRRALQPLNRKCEYAEHYETHVAHRGVRDQLLENGLDHRYEGSVHDAHQRQDAHGGRRHDGCGREKGQTEAQQAVGPHLEKHPG